MYSSALIGFAFFFLVYALFFCAPVGLIGMNRLIGFWGAFWVSLLLSPIVGLIAALVSVQRSDIEYQQEMLRISGLKAERNGYTVPVIDIKERAIASQKKVTFWLMFPGIIIFSLIFILLFAFLLDSSKSTPSEMFSFKMPWNNTTNSSVVYSEQDLNRLLTRLKREPLYQIKQEAYFPSSYNESDSFHEYMKSFDNIGANRITYNAQVDPDNTSMVLIDVIHSHNYQDLVKYRLSYNPTDQQFEFRGEY